ncbi:MAG: hypothetical protein CME06_04675 [Gemmatimonadetes bacterium]|nr:hypothetical protein [Gemmatimonadota bacterium]
MVYRFGTLWLLLAAIAAPMARAHDFGVSYSRIELSAKEVSIAMSINADELPPAVSLDDSGDGFITESEALAHESAIRAFFESKLRVEKDGRGCSAQAGPVSYAPMTTAVETILRFDCPPGPGAVKIDYSFVPAFYHPHRNVATVVLGSQERTFLFSAKRSTMTARLVGNEIARDEAALRSGAALAWAGARGVLTTADAILLAACFWIGPAPAIAALAAGHLVGALLAATGAIALSTGALSAALALAIAFVALENSLGRGGGSGRWVVALPAGLLLGSVAVALLSRGTDIAALSTGATFAHGFAGAVTLAILAIAPKLVLARFWERVNDKAWLAIVLIGLLWFAARAFDFDLPAGELLDPLATDLRASEPSP